MTNGDDPFLQLQREFLNELPALLAEIRNDIGTFRQGRGEATASLRTRFHRLAGSGGSYGFPAISEIGRETELWLATTPGSVEAPRLDAALTRLEQALAQARQQLAPRDGSDPAASSTPDFGTPQVFRVRLILPAGRDRDRLAEALAGNGVQVDVAGTREEPAEVPPETRPDLVVIGTAAGEGDPSAIAFAWTARRDLRPRAVVLIETLRAVDRLRAVAAGVDAVFSAERMVEELPRYVRTLARIGAPPSRVLLVDPDGGRAAALGEQLKQANVHVIRSPLAQPVQELLDREVPDLLVIATPLADADACTLARTVRQDPRFHLLPILFLGQAGTADRIAALRAGADDFLPWPVDADLLLQTVIARAERGRRIREMLHRDELTGLVNHGTIMAELEHSVAYAHHYGGPLAFLVFDLDRFVEVNDRYGQSIGDRVLLHVANVFRSSVRASDIIGRYGGEEFAMILRGGNEQGAAVVGEKLRRVLGERPATTPEGLVIPVQVSVGWSVYPSDGATAGELAHGAVRELKKGKAKG
jgi:diguanylate cyclase (GGDEF)-like protein